MTDQALRKNEGKLQLSYILDALPALEDMVRVMEFGANKYERNNWQKGFPKDKLLDSLLRHVGAFYNGEDIDPESGESHVGHILCNAMFLAYHYGSNSRYWEDKEVDLNQEVNIGDTVIINELGLIGEVESITITATDTSYGIDIPSIEESSQYETCSLDEIKKVSKTYV